MRQPFVVQKPHLVGNTFLRIPIGNYIHHYLVCHRFGSYPCYNLASPANDMGKFHRTARPAAAVVCESVSHSFRIDASKNSNWSSFQPDSFWRYTEEATFVVSFSTRKSNSSQ